MSFEEIDIPERLYDELHALFLRVVRTERERNRGFDIWLDCEMAALLSEWDESWSYDWCPDQRTRTVLVTAEVAFILIGISIATGCSPPELQATVASRVLPVPHEREAHQ